MDRYGRIFFGVCFGALITYRPRALQDNRGRSGVRRALRLYARLGQLVHASIRIPRLVLVRAPDEIKISTVAELVDFPLRYKLRRLRRC
jgi:hypothetical protein